MTSRKLLFLFFLIVGLYFNLKSKSSISFYSFICDVVNSISVEDQWIVMMLQMWYEMLSSDVRVGKSKGLVVGMDHNFV